MSCGTWNHISKTSNMSHFHFLSVCVSIPCNAIRITRDCTRQFFVFLTIGMFFLILVGLVIFHWSDFSNILLISDKHHSSLEMKTPSIIKWWTS